MSSSLTGLDRMACSGPARYLLVYGEASVMSQISVGQDATELRAWDTYQAPRLECDVVMKGGITSGVLYPLAVCELAKVYHLRNVGGTSAGAIAAAAAAAAEHGRAVNDPAAGFQGLAALPEWLNSDNHLEELFRPPTETRGLHKVLMRFVQPKKNWASILLGIGMAGFSGKRAWMPVVGAALGGVCLAAVLVDGPDSVLDWVAVVMALLVTVVGLLVGSVASLALTSGEHLAANFYGIVAGSQSYDGKDSLSDWLADQIDTLAGRSTEGDPLTFGDLWRGPDGTGTAANPHVNLEMQTTNVTQGRPMRLPDELASTYSFDVDKFRRLFPERVVDYLLRNPGGEVKASGLVPLPEPSKLPVVVATRMSLSFPVLISAVPLFAVDHSMGPGRKNEVCWFSDGGITSNFPISFFDELLPSRPTFGINLRDFHERFPKNETDERANVWMPRTNRDGQREWWSRWPDVHGIKGVGKFLRAIADTMQNWVDNTQTRVPGFRDRIVHISHDHGEGGMNLAMPPKTLTRLATRGQAAGQRLVDYYTNAPGVPLAVDELYRNDKGEIPRRVVSWENHRQTRLRTSLSLVTAATGLLVDGYDEAYQKDLQAPLNKAPSYPFNNETQRALAIAVMNGSSGAPARGGPPLVELPAGLVELVGAVRSVEATESTMPLAAGSPSPAPVMRVWPGRGPSPRAVGVPEPDPAAGGGEA